MIRKEGNDPHKYTLSRRNKKVSNSNFQTAAMQSNFNETWESLSSNSNHTDGLNSQICSDYRLVKL